MKGFQILSNKSVLSCSISFSPVAHTVNEEMHPFSVENNLSFVHPSIIHFACIMLTFFKIPVSLEYYILYFTYLYFIF